MKVRVPSAGRDVWWSGYMAGQWCFVARCRDVISWFGARADMGTWYSIGSAVTGGFLLRSGYYNYLSAI